ncbi:hypothetical protein FHT40_004602 [Mycolicibacterium sp. BK556]|uniref:hypothetical protein n=1 Tax=Mycobacteriaceae TaxID=1762 RepID=UPI00105E4A38|nr:MULTISPECIES: hypothetical protein [Mycobacteriaceae]MBB3604918.1 hypothetical protein [Mycolicibacterium sp. BK556]MBB3635114.1 hypothetical protein [Mycolicibacterium sp. BK607]MBB3748091.1 hypothetical protein [Mycolicibacterium sp. BK634]TDO07777.1 hypothetical protein EV580_5345 [Mycobacterium sp. BK086]
MPPQNTPWYRSAAATSAAGLLGLALIAILVYAVVTMSSKWSTSETETVLPPGTHLPAPPQVGGKTTTGSTSTSYPPVRLSTTDIGLPGETTTSGTPTTTSDQSAIPPAERTAPTFPGTFPTRVTNPPGPRTSRPGPRLNETRTASP